MGGQRLELVGSGVNGRPVISRSFAATFSAKPSGEAFRPVPTAVPPWASS
jgi:hypothetical protein